MGATLSQRDYMRRLVEKIGRNKNAACSAYAAGERRGEVARSSNDYKLTPEQYAEALWSDGERKGWLFRQSK
jgi:hypothetical protein